MLKEFLKDFHEQFTRELFTYRYKNAQLLLDGANDFLNGIDWLKKQDGAQLNLDVMKRGYQMKYVSELEIPFDFPLYERTMHMVESKAHQIKRKLLLNGMFLKTNGNAIVPTVDPHILYFYRKNYVLNYDYTSQKGFVTHKDNVEFKRLHRAFKQLKKRCEQNYDKIVKEYRNRSKEITNLSFWNNYLDINK